jgi:hypothetical protein
MLRESARCLPKYYLNLSRSVAMLHGSSRCLPSLHEIHRVVREELGVGLVHLILARQIVHIQMAVLDIDATPEGSQMGIVGGCGVRHGASTAGEQMAQVVGHLFGFVVGQIVLVPETVVLGGPSRALET